MQLIGNEPLTPDDRELVERRFRPVGGCTRAFELGAFVVILPMFLALIATTLLQRWLGDNPGCAAGAGVFLLIAAATYFIVRRRTSTLSLRDFDSSTTYQFEVTRAVVIDEDTELYLLETTDGDRVLLRAWMCEDIFPQRVITMKTIAPLNLIVTLRAEGGELEVEEGETPEELHGDYRILG
jgi:hypothetical protein